MVSKLRQTIPRRKDTVSLDNKTLKRSLAVHFQSYPLALAEKEQLATASAIFGIYDSTQSATPIPVTRNAEPIRRKAEPIRRKAEPIRQDIQFRNTKCIRSDRSILGLSVQGLVSHIINNLIALSIFVHVHMHAKHYYEACMCLLSIVVCSVCVKGVSYL